MSKVVGWLIAIWVMVGFVIILMLAVSPAMDEIASSSADEIAASGNMSEIVGIESAVRSYPVWKWGLPVLLGIGFSGWILYKNREELRRRI